MKTLLNELRAYFNAIENPTEQEKRIRLHLSDKFYPITSVHRDDLKSRGFDTDRITDEQMEELADKMADDYFELFFWESMTTLAEIMGLPKRRGLLCPKCESELIGYDISDRLYHCKSCGLTWNEEVYVLVEHPEDASYFEQEEIGYPSWESEDNGARYVPEYEYIHQFGKIPCPEKCYRPVCWPESQAYMDSDRCELIQDESALAELGTSAYWVPRALTDTKNG